MKAKYKKLFIIFLIFSALTGLIYFYLLSTVKPPVLDKKNLFTLSSRSPEYLLNPINIKDLTDGGSTTYPYVNISPKNILYPIINFFQYWEFGQIKYDDAFFASKKIAEMIEFGKDISWDKQLDDYSYYINRQIKTYSNIRNPIVKLNRFIDLNKRVLAHQQRVYSFLPGIPNISKEDIQSKEIQLDKTFTPIYQKINKFLPAIHEGNLIYPLINPLLDRELGTYEAQFVTDDKSSGDIRLVNIDEKSDYLYFSLSPKPQKQQLVWERGKDENNALIYTSNINLPETDKQIMLTFNYHNERTTKISIVRNFKEAKTSQIKQVKLLDETVYPHKHPTLIRRSIDSQQLDPLLDQSYVISLEIVDQQHEDYYDSFPALDLIVSPIIDSAPQLLITKKATNYYKEPDIATKKISNFNYKLIIDNFTFFNGRQIKYNLGFGWAIDDATKIIFYYPGILISRLVAVFVFFSIFFALCLILKQPLDILLFDLLKKTVTILTYIVKTFFIHLKKMINSIKLWFLFFGFIFMVIETFFHNESSDSLVLTTVVLWILAIIGYSLESRFTFVLAFVFLVSGVSSLILLPGDMTVYRLETIAKKEFIADKFAIWTIVFIVMGFINTLLELSGLVHTRSIKEVFAQIKKDWKLTVSRLSFIKQALKQTFKLIKKIYIPKSLNIKDILASTLRILITFFIPVVIFSLLIINNEYQSFLNTQPRIKKAEPKIVYRSTRVILWGTSIGGEPSGKNIRLMSPYGEVHKDFWSDSKIIFTVPQNWKDGELKIWIEKPVHWRGQVNNSKSNTMTIRLIPTSLSFTPTDDLFFKQLKTLDKETLKINGY